MLYVIHAYDPTDADALARRITVRPAHLDFVRQLKADNKYVMGGALLSPEGTMLGSMLVLDLPTPDDLDTYLKTDPYIVENIWEKIDVKPFRQAEV